MKHNPISTANAFAITTGIFYVACRVLVGLFPNLMFTVAQSWFHGVALTKFDTGSLTMSTFLIGLVSSLVFTWVTGYIFAKIYNLMKS
ncbi:hypothetical protein A2422_01530 [Candidatus Woesebacteria bacterium RIFOXYC1_FULL_31_51]|uniref:Uncharacterized protein n=1 Tax=Candidatus Woesebacteria bacterium GW2011_GWC2_31_9 TaxID=1618586 RepID=A0A0G0BL64_9BACT|nr:MAG: hypothetical protein UR17_C0001G0760 [Candidatus Woesebacteria bacterium GW2011_GWF1_31_35]KKP22637.1 MAG: hypothetical protein UR11_C0002G0017 [Candidatus Woesebacteria bacterium GW2011_GWC1_30_29]KKP26931.1 MAG: hypothetical protein UR13_C0001G0026 [Candidatus Woesebacteria bacterium GW2011_GWD1_31_12]KKP27232.1 MAG: hypothetical protein UR16_C0005G0019 [Candidatus Woesebacteria bacterium GW2011_GWB1_31_29]KKP30824.1 MAG: hypothetical protein UR20_C0051G0008 [Candidatus Woesebacteria 